jgi:hypothetical protein
VWGEREARQGTIHFCSLNNQLIARPEKEEEKMNKLIGSQK